MEASGRKIGVSAAFVNSGKYRVRNNEWRLVEWQTALPAGLSIAAPEAALEQINSWQPDYDRFFFDQLKKRSTNIVLFRGEFIFELARTVVAKVPQLGNATYVIREARGHPGIRTALCHDNTR